MSMRDPVIKKITTARVSMVMTNGMEFFGHLAVRLIIKEIDVKYCKTMGTDGRHLYFCREFVESMDVEELKFVIGHEVMHCCYDHMGRRGRRDPDVWNCANDYVINLELVRQRVGKMFSRPNDDPPFLPCYDEKYEGMSSDEIYEILLDEQKRTGKKIIHNFDVHFDPNEEPDPDSGIEILTDEERALISDEIRQATMNAAKAAGDNVPDGVKRMLKELLEPQMDWREYLTIATQALVKSDFTYARPNRRNSSLGGIILPGNEYDDAIDVCCAIDTSGSISETMIQEFVSEVKGIMEQFKQFKLRLWCFDTATYTVWEFDQDNIEDIHDFYPEGGGGTEFDVNWTMMKDKNIEPDQLVIFTDGYPWSSWGDPDYQENLIYLISGNKTITAPFGVTLYYE